MSSDSDDEPPIVGRYGDGRVCYYVVAVGLCADARIRQLRSVECALLLRPT